MKKDKCCNYIRTGLVNYNSSYSVLQTNLFKILPIIILLLPATIHVFIQKHDNNESPNKFLISKRMVTIPKIIVISLYIEYVCKYGWF